MSNTATTQKIKLSSKSAQIILDTLLQMGVNVKLISKRFKLLQITHGDKHFFIKGTSFHLNPQPSTIIANNKYLTKKVLQKFNILTPKSYLVKNLEEARAIVKKHNFYPCVLKPTKGAHGNKVYANIETPEELELVLTKIFSKNEQKDILVEQYIEGPDYRVLVVGNKASAVMERIPAHVIGDGKSTIRQLITVFNSSPLVGKKYEKPMCKIRLNGEVRRNLIKQGLKYTYIPAFGEQIFLRQNANISTGGIGKDATDIVPKSVKNTAINAAYAIGMQISGVDIIFNKLDSKAYVIELNDQPGIDIHHFPVLGKPRNVALDIIELLLGSTNASMPLIQSNKINLISPAIIHPPKLENHHN